MLPPPKAICLDLDDTLLDGSQFMLSVERTCAALASRLGLEPGRVLASNQSVWGGYWLDVEEAWTLGEISGESLTRETWRQTLANLDLRDESLVDFAYDTHMRLADEGQRLFDDAVAFLQAVESRFPLALITNGAADTQRNKLRVLAIEHRFDAIVVSGEVGRKKPDAHVFELALDQLGARAGTAWHIGDSLQSDIAGARAAGLTGIWINRHSHVRTADDPEPHHEVAALTELLALLQ